MIFRPSRPPPSPVRHAGAAPPWAAKVRALPAVAMRDTLAMGCFCPAPPARRRCKVRPADGALTPASPKDKNYRQMISILPSFHSLAASSRGTAICTKRG